MGRIGVVRIPLQVDIGFGDTVVPAPQTVELPALLGHAPPRLSAYRRETVVAEKLHAIVDLGFTNTRMKDYFDLWFLSANFAFDGVALAEAIAATFDRRSTSIPDALPTGLTGEFGDDSTKQAQWRGFLRRSGLTTAELELELGEVVSVIVGFLAPPMAMARRPEAVSMRWPAGGPWTAITEPLP